ncbi:SGNH hydrolase [Solihabitans fulvus]|uniref:SGNH hydrolase n=1 Tax=Solihabitans fulvus TaxID=1892852 RepID=A0A5B2WHB9_9PSEU|nr:LamG-like jellyroll fold domain-containing protein [Solihabitans fulvus]KAA2249537.1 SGNH hydrolase [Solihabitans fulvus]
MVRCLNGSVVVLATAVALAVGVAGPATAAQPVAHAGPQPSAGPSGKDAQPQDPAEATAVQQAKDTGKPVEVDGHQTQMSTVLANPDRTFTLQANARPVRVNKDGGWKAVDTTLAKRGDGLLAPAAAAVDVAFSPGGSAPLVTLAKGDKKLQLSWPTPLPAPVLNGSAATYPAVFPGVDLQVSATADSYSETLIVHDATAAKNPALANVTLTATGTGLALSASPDGTLTAKDSAGADVLHGTMPIMWDSHHDDHIGPAPTSTEPGSGRVTPLKVTTAPASTSAAAPRASTTTTDSGPPTTSLVITPDPAALTGPDVIYPVFIDPSMSPNSTDWSEYTENGWSYVNANQDAQVGQCGTWPGCSGLTKARSFFRMPTPDLAARNGRNAVVSSAWFYATQVHGATKCTAQPVDLWRTNALGSASSWPGPSGWKIDQQSSAAGDTCGGPGSIQFNAMGVAVDAANGSWPEIAFGLVSPNENDQNQWKKFGNNASLSITFAFPPNPASALGVAGAVMCTGTAVAPTGQPTLLASATDNNNPPLNTGLNYQVFTATGSNMAAASPAVWTASGSTGAWTVNPSLGDGAWAYRVAVQNSMPGDGSGGVWNGTWSPWVWFYTRATPPQPTPTISSLDYQPNYWGPARGSFTVNAGGATNIAGFTYTFAGSGSEATPNTGDCDYNKTFTNGGWVANTNGAATVTVPAGMTPGYHTLYVRSFDDAHNLSPESTAYTFYTAPDYGVNTRLQAGDATQVTVSQPAGQNIPTSSVDCVQPCPAGSKGLLFKGTAVNQSFTMSVNTPIEADYALGAHVAKGPYTALLGLAVDGTPVGPADSAVNCNNCAQLSVYRPLGGVHLTKGQHLLKATLVNPVSMVTGADAQRGWNAQVDDLTVIPINNVITDNFTDAMNNHGISNDTATGNGNFDLEGGSLSAQAMAAAGLAPGQKVTISGTTFTMPAANSTGNDNVVAAGQTIPLPTVKSNAVGLLVASTCGNSPQVTGTLAYADGKTTSNPFYPQVSDWVTASANTAAFTLPYRNVAGGQETGVQPRVYAIFLPADPSKTLASITLPLIGTNFLPGCPQPALHVLAMAARPVSAGWLGTWAAPADATTIPPGGSGFANQTLRMVVHPTVTGTTTRIRLSNTGASAPVTIDAATMSAQSGTGAATTGAPAALSFCAAAGQTLGCGARTVTIPVGGEIYSDPIAYPTITGASGNLTVSLHLPAAVTQAPTHGLTNTTNYLATGNTTTNADGSPYTTSVTSSYYLTGVDVSTTDSSAGTVAVLGDQTSTGRASNGTFPTWVDDLPAKLGSSLPGSIVNTSLAGIQPTGAWKLNDGTGTTATDTSGSHNGTLTDGATWSNDHNGSATFYGTHGIITTTGTTLNTTQSYSIAAWVKLTSTNNFYTAVGQGGATMGAFYLQYSAEMKAWAFVSPNSDSPTAPQSSAHATSPPALNTWTHLIGAFDAATGTMSLYVNGQLAGTATNPTPWNAAAPLSIGGVQGTNGGTSNFFNGSVSGVRAYQRALTATDATLIYTAPSVGTPPGIGAATTANAGATLNNTALDEPNLRTVVVALGTNDILAGTDAATIERNLTALMNASSPAGMKRYFRSDGSALHLVIATIAPLGLDGSDQREKNRQQLNTDILAHYNAYGADDVVDFSTAVQSSTDNTKTDPSFLTSGIPNAAYHDKLAQTLSDATGFPATVQL